jgi:hypothetical protein
MAHPNLLGHHNTQGMIYMSPAKTQHCNATRRKTKSQESFRALLRMCITYLLAYEFIQYEHLGNTNPEQFNTATSSS